MPVVNKAAAPASCNIDIGGYGSRVALRLPGTTGIDSNVKQPAKSLLLVIASEAKQSISPRKERMDCFVASLLAMTARHTSAISPHVLREVWPARSALFRKEGAGNAGRPMRPIAACAEIVRCAHALVRSHRNHPAFPAQWFYGLFRALPGDRAFLPPSPLRSLHLTNLTPASGRQDHTTSPSASRIARQARPQRPPHPAPRFVTLRNAPPEERDGCGYKVICVF